MAFEKFTGKTLEEALGVAAKAKNVNVDELHYTITEEKAGFLGLGKQVEVEVYTEKDVEQFIYNYVQSYFDNAQLDGEVTISNDDGFYHINVNTSNNAILIGKAGRSLQAFNRLVKMAASAEFKKENWFID